MERMSLEVMPSVVTVNIFDNRFQVAFVWPCINIKSSRGEMYSSARFLTFDHSNAV